MLDNAGTRFLDDVTKVDFEVRAPAPIAWARTAHDIAATVRALANRRAEPAGVV
jgi:hypothetical protein